MSQTNTPCRKCGQPRMPNHTFAGFAKTGTPVMECGRDPKEGADEVLEALNRLWADSDAKDEADLLNGVRTLWNGGDQKAATDLLMSADRLRIRLQAAEGNASKADGQLDRKTSDLSEAFTRVANLEREKAALKGKVLQLETERQSSIEVVIAATRTETANEIAELDQEVARLQETNRNLTDLLAAADKRVEAAEARASVKDVALLEKPKKQSAERQTIDVIVPEALAPAPAPAAIQADGCMFCDRPASMIAENAFPLKHGGFYPRILCCKYFGSHIADILDGMSGHRTLLVDPPTEEDHVRPAFKIYTPNA